MDVARFGIRMSSKPDTSCRICNANHLVRLGTFADLPLPDGAQAERSSTLLDLTVGYCPECQMVQRIGDTDLSSYYQAFSYTVGTSPFVTRFVNALAQNIVNRFPSTQSNGSLRVLDIGCNTGTQLVAFQTLGCDVYGVEPSRTLAQVASERGLPILNEAFDTNIAAQLLYDHGQMDIVISTFTLDQVDDPIGFLRGVKRLLQPETGVVVLEVHDVRITYANHEIALFDREHSIFPDKVSLENLLNLAGLECIEYNFLPAELCRENSLLVIARHSPAIYHPKVNSDSQANLQGHLAAFEILNTGTQNLSTFLEQCELRGVRVAGYGAGYRGIMYCSLISNPGAFSYFVDGNGALHGTQLPKSKIDVYSPNHLNVDPVDCIVVFSHGYLGEITAVCSSFGYSESAIVSLPKILSGDVISPSGN